MVLVLAADRSRTNFHNIMCMSCTSDKDSVAKVVAVLLLMVLRLPPLLLLLLLFLLLNIMPHDQLSSHMHTGC
jgi:hypothetical protein